MVGSGVFAALYIISDHLCPEPRANVYPGCYEYENADSDPDVYENDHPRWASNENADASSMRSGSSRCANPVSYLNAYSRWANCN